MLHKVATLFILETSKQVSLANSEDPDEMQHTAAFHQGLHCLLRQNQSSKKDIQYYLVIITCNLSIHTTDPEFSLGF